MFKQWFMCFCSIKSWHLNFFLYLSDSVFKDLIIRNLVCRVSGKRSIRQYVKLADQKDRCYNLISICRLTMSSAFVGCIVSIDCGEVLGMYQGQVTCINNSSQELTITKAFRNGLKCPVSEITLKWVSSNISELKSCFDQEQKCLQITFKMLLCTFFFVTVKSVICCSLFLTVPQISRSWR